MKMMRMSLQSKLDELILLLNGSRTCPPDIPSELFPSEKNANNVVEIGDGMIKQQMLLASIHLPLIISFNCGENSINMLIKEYNSTISLVHPTSIAMKLASFLSTIGLQIG